MFITGIEGEKLSELLHFRTRWPLELWPGLHQTESGLVSDRNMIELSFDLGLCIDDLWFVSSRSN